MFPASTRILVVDDMATMRGIIRNQLRTIGFDHFIEAKNGLAAFTLLGEHFKRGEPIELVLSDWNMAEMGGLDLLRRVRATEQIKDVPFLMITAADEAHQVQEAIASGVSNYLMKPFTPSTLKEKLELIWRKHHAVT
jgi:two-component system chemotaxis response regulator CheY